jgi:large subunit ribosomal protein L32
MAVPKRRHSTTRGRKRRTHWVITTRDIATCAHCGQPKLPHRVCAECGYYKGEQVITPKAD